MEPESDQVAYLLLYVPCSTIDTQKTTSQGKRFLLVRLLQVPTHAPGTAASYVLAQA